MALLAQVMCHGAVITSIATGFAWHNNACSDAGYVSWSSHNQHRYRHYCAKQILYQVLQWKYLELSYFCILEPVTHLVQMTLGLDSQAMESWQSLGICCHEAWTPCQRIFLPFKGWRMILGLVVDVKESAK